MNVPNILVVNDDGINARGIGELVLGLSKVARVYVCAPEGERSARSQAITLSDSVFVREANLPGARLALTTSGTPADCTKIGLQFYREKGIHIDMVFSGINMGSNLGKDTLYSGTVGAAMEGAISGVQSVAVSVDDHKATYFEGAVKMARDIIPMIYGKVSPKIIMNINVPNVPLEEIRGVKALPLGGRYYIDKFVSDGNENNGYVLEGEPAVKSEEKGEVDTEGILENYAVVTPLTYDYTDYTYLNQVKEWKFNL